MRVFIKALETAVEPDFVLCLHLKDGGTILQEGREDCSHAVAMLHTIGDMWQIRPANQHSITNT